MAKSKKLTFGFAVTAFNLDIEGTIDATFQPGSPAVFYQRNGDPGWPADPDEVEVQEVVITDIASQELQEPIILDAKGHDEFWTRYEKQILQWAIDCYSDQYDGPED